MTIEEMHDLCDVIMDKNNAPWYTPEEKDKFIQLAELEFVKNKEQTYEVDEKGRKDVLTLVRKYSAGSSTSINLDSIDNLMYIVQVKGIYTNSCGKEKIEPIVPIQLDDEVELENDPLFDLGKETKGYIETYENGFRELIINSDDVLTNIEIRYIKKPRLVSRDVNVPANSVDSELPIHVHEEIVDIAVRKMLGSVQDQFQYQVQQNEEQKK